MNTKAHVFLGTTTAVAFSHFVLGFDIRQDFLVGAGVVLGSILPDVDHPGAWLSNHFPTTATLLCKFFGLSGKCFGDDHYQQTLKIHRGICHSFAACIQIIQLFIVFLFFSDGRLTLFSLCWGMLFHILVDCFSPMGCMLFAPFSNRLYSFSTKPIRRQSESVCSKNIFWYILLYICNLFVSFGGLLSILPVLVVIQVIIEHEFSADVVTSIKYAVLITGFIVISRVLRHLLLKKITTAYVSDNAKDLSAVDDLSAFTSDEDSAAVETFDYSGDQEDNELSDEDYLPNSAVSPASPASDIDMQNIIPFRPRK